MRTYAVYDTISKLQDNLYAKINSFSETNKILGHLSAIPVALLDVALDTLKTPLGGIECIALAAINLIGAAFSKKFTIKDALASTQFALGCTANIPVALMMAPIKMIFQASAIAINPRKVQSINYNKAAFQEDKPSNQILSSVTLRPAPGKT